MTMAVGACKTTEKNYRRAYDRTMADSTRNVTPFNETIYGRYRNQVTLSKVTDGSRDITVHDLRVTVTPDGGGINEWLKTYSVVVGEFKQLFNARSLRQRFYDAGYSRAFLVQNAEPYYYIVVDSSDDLSQMTRIADSLRTATPVPLKADFPYILRKVGR